MNEEQVRVQVYDLKVFIFNETQAISANMFPAIKENLIQRIKSGNKIVRFEAMELKNGSVCIRCSNEESVKWLLNIKEMLVSYKSVFWFNSDIILSIKSSNYFKNSYLISFTHDFSMKLDFDLSLIPKQNNGIKIKEWCSLAKKTIDDKVLHLYKIDSLSVEYLRNHNWQLHYEFSILKIQKFDDRLYKTVNIISIRDDERKLMFSKNELVNAPGIELYNVDIFAL